MFKLKSLFLLVKRGEEKEREGKEYFISLCIKPNKIILFPLSFLPLKSFPSSSFPFFEPNIVHAW